jgi:cytochrome c553
MKNFLKRTGLALGGLLGLAVLTVAAVYLLSAWRYNTGYDVDARAVAVPPPTDSVAVARGRHIATTRGCADCHAQDFGGTTFIDDPMMGRLTGSNLTSGNGGVGSGYTDADWVRALRHGIGPTGKPLAFMPSEEYTHLGDDDLGALIAYLKQLPPVDRKTPEPAPGPMARLLTLMAGGGLPTLAAETIDHEAARSRAAAPPARPTAAYGEYLAPSCTGCHGTDFAGGPIPGAPPAWPKAANLTPHPEDGLGAWSKADFVRALRKQRRPDGTQVDSVMPAAMGKMTDTELAALWNYLQTLPAKASTSS